MAKEYLIGDFLKRIKRPIDLLDDTEYNLVTVKMNHNGVTLRERKKGYEIKSNMYLVKYGDFILSGIDARNGAFGIIPNELDNAIVTNDFWYFEIDENIILKELFLELTATNWFDEICKKGSDGTTQRIRLQKDKFFNQSVWLPEKNEQQNILTKIKKIKSYLHKLSIENVKQTQLGINLKESILQDAIEGKLTAFWRLQNRNKSTANIFLSHIKEEKSKLIKERIIKKESSNSIISKTEEPFKLPDSWLWIYVSELAQVFTGDSINKDIKNSKYKIVQKGLNYIGTKDVDFEMKGINYETGVIIPMNEVNNPFKVAPANSILICIEGGSSGKKIGLTSQNVCFGNKLLATIPYTTDLSKYLYFLYNSPHFKKEFETHSKGLRGGVSINSFKTIKIPLPPLDELKLIVEKVEVLINCCGKLNQEVNGLNNYSKILLKAMFNETFETKTVVAE